MSQPEKPTSGTVFDTKLGWISVDWSGDQVCQVSFGNRNKTQALRRLLGPPVTTNKLTAAQETLVQRLKDYAAGAQDDFQDVPVALSTTRFRQRVYKHCRRIPRGKTASYAMLASRAGSPRAARAVGSAMANNPIPLIVPCHRVVRSGGLGEFSAPGGQSMKRRLLALEGAAE